MQVLVVELEAGDTIDDEEAGPTLLARELLIAVEETAAREDVWTALDTMLDDGVTETGEVVGIAAVDEEAADVEATVDDDEPA